MFYSNKKNVFLRTFLIAVLFLYPAIELTRVIHMFMQGHIWSYEPFSLEGFLNGSFQGCFYFEIACIWFFYFLGVYLVYRWNKNYFLKELKT